MSTTFIESLHNDGDSEPSKPYIKVAGGLDSSNIIRPLRIDPNGDLSISANSIVSDFKLEVAQGAILIYKGHHEVGERESLAAVTQGEDIWMGAASSVPIPPIVGEQMTVVSTDVNDNPGGSGVREIRIEYLDSNGLEQEESITMNGTTGVNTVATDIRYVNAIHATAVGSNGVAEGDITIHQFGAPSTVYDIIATGGNMSLTITYMVPYNKTLYVSSWMGSVSGNKRVSLRLRANARNGVIYEGTGTVAGDPVFLFIDSMNLVDATAVNQFDPYVCIPGGAVIKISGWAAAGAFASGSFQGFLVEDIGT
jgi:hypothetical protein